MYCDVIVQTSIDCACTEAKDLHLITYLDNTSLDTAGSHSTTTCD